MQLHLGGSAEDVPLGGEIEIQWPRAAAQSPVGGLFPVQLYLRSLPAGTLAEPLHPANKQGPPFWNKTATKDIKQIPVASRRRPI